MASPWPLTFSSGERPRALWALLFRFRGWAGLNSCICWPNPFFEIIIKYQNIKISRKQKTWSDCYVIICICFRHYIRTTSASQCKRALVRCLPVDCRALKMPFCWMTSQTAVNQEMRLWAFNMMTVSFHQLLYFTYFWWYFTADCY